MNIPTPDLIRDLEHELQILQNRLACAITRGHELLDRADTHLGHNLGTSATEIAGILGQITSTTALLNHVRGGR